MNRLEPVALVGCLARCLNHQYLPATPQAAHAGDRHLKNRQDPNGAIRLGETGDGVKVYIKRSQCCSERGGPADTPSSLHGL